MTRMRSASRATASVRCVAAHESILLVEHGAQEGDVLLLPALPQSAQRARLVVGPGVTVGGQLGEELRALRIAPQYQRLGRLDAGGKVLVPLQYAAEVLRFGRLHRL